ncbi:hypothetical protein [Vibrio phage vB_ValS_PJ32]|nr:hypothetical protein [Vibrio phage vB_ValS_PJ32]
MTNAPNNCNVARGVVRRVNQLHKARHKLEEARKELTELGYTEECARIDALLTDLQERLNQETKELKRVGVTYRRKVTTNY